LRDFADDTDEPVREMRHVLLHLLRAEEFERISSGFLAFPWPNPPSGMTSTSRAPELGVIVNSTDPREAAEIAHDLWRRLRAHAHLPERPGNPRLESSAGDVRTLQEECRQREAQVRRANRLAEPKQMLADRDAGGEQVGGRKS
jgi:hypothetical protein